ncbi:MAG: ABC transporter ATP-binding protein [Ignisphaera sp.]|uniref:ABC transporter ATP-binding protein n=1 Tax=Ignisphaera aggregans TaxID=334771 RepID=A0A7J3I8D6_9CREN
MPRIEVRNLTVRYGERSVLNGVDAEFDSGVHVVLGRNGAGKTTLLRAIAGLVEFTGDIRVDGRSIKGLNRRELAKLIAYCWQNPFYGFIEVSVKDEVEVILRTLGVSGNRYIVDILVPKHITDRDPTTLSGGEARRVSLASILVADQPIWLLDEPFTNLDRDGIEALLKVVEYGRGRGKTIVISLHEVFYAYLLNPDTYIVIDDGKIVRSGGWNDISDDTLISTGLLTVGDICVKLYNR